MNFETWVQALPEMVNDAITTILSSDGSTPLEDDVVDHHDMVSVTAWTQVWPSTNTAASTSTIAGASMTSSEITVIGLGRFAACFENGAFLYLLTPGAVDEHARFINEHNLPSAADMVVAHPAPAFSGSPEVAVGVAPPFVPAGARTGRWSWVPTSENWGPSFALDGHAVLFASVYATAPAGRIPVAGGPKRILVTGGDDTAYVRDFNDPTYAEIVFDMLPATITAAQLLANRFVRE